jgi:TRAP-type mannitol/chloroaromatic compound transport system permease small subunit
MKALARFVAAVDAVNRWIGHGFAWSILVLTLVISYEVLVRYAFRAPTRWAFDASYMLYGLLFMTAGAYTLSRNGHVRADFLYRNFSPRKQAAIDLALYVLFFFPGILALILAGWGFVRLSYIIQDHSPFSPRGPLMWPFKALIPVVGVLMFAQGLAEVARCILCLRTGIWPARHGDVEETEKVALEHALHELHETKKTSPR